MAAFAALKRGSDGTPAACCSSGVTTGDEVGNEALDADAPSVSGSSEGSGAIFSIITVHWTLPTLPTPSIALTSTACGPSE